MNDRKIALVIKTDGLEYDDRVRKEILSVQKLYPNIKFKILAMLPDNLEKEGVTGYGIPYKALYIPSRDKYPSASKATLKAWQFYKAVKCEVKDFDAVWVANEDASFVPMFLKHKRILWDLHELPMHFIGNMPMRILLRMTFNRCNVIVHANPHREHYLKSIGVIKDSSKHFALRNYPDFEELDRDYDALYNSFIDWKGERRCVYLQGLNMDRRAPFESIRAVLSIPDLCAVVVGGFDASIKRRLEEAFGDQLQERVLFIGKIPQLKIPQYIKQCYTTLVFYKNVSPNNYYCEANRFYQAVVLGLPVVVGNNPSMKELVEEYGYGVAIDDDGCSINKIVEGLKLVIERYEEYRENIINNRSKIIWDNQEPVLSSIVNNLFN